MINDPPRVGWCLGQTGGYEFNTKSSDIKVKRSRHENHIEKEDSQRGLDLGKLQCLVISILLLQYF